MAAVKTVRKRANGEGSIAKVEGRGWVARFTYVDPITGQTKRSASYAATKTEALDKMQGVKDRVSKGLATSDSPKSVGEFTRHWLMTSLEAAGIKATTKATYRTLAESQILNAPIAKIRLRDLKASDVEAFVVYLREEGRKGKDGKASGLSDATVRQTYTVLRKILDAAERDGLTTRNVAALIDRPRVARKEAEHLTPAEVKAILQAAEGTRYHSLFTLLANSGLRRGEALALSWSDVDLEDRTMRVRGTLGRVNGSLEVTDAKTEKSRRTVALPKSLVTLLKEQRQQQAIERSRAGDLWQESGLVFTTETGTPVDPRNALRAFTSAVKKSGVGQGHGPIGLHTLRHSAATGMLNAGLAIHTVSAILGHSSVAITGDIYGHTTTDDQRAAIDVLDRLFA